MYCRILAISQKPPTWCHTACQEYLVRLQSYFKCSVITVPAEKRHKSSFVQDCITLEGHRLLKLIKPHEWVIALDCQGQKFNSEKFKQEIQHFTKSGQHVVFLIGGADGLATVCLDRANQTWALSDLTFTHHLAQLLLLEHLYRAGSILAGHPYHRA